MGLQVCKAGQNGEGNEEHDRAGKLKERGSFIVAEVTSRILIALLSNLEEIQEWDFKAPDPFLWIAANQRLLAFHFEREFSI